MMRMIDETKRMNLLMNCYIRQSINQLCHAHQRNLIVNCKLQMFIIHCFVWQWH